MQCEKALPYEVLESRRARNVRICLSREGRLSVVVPAGFHRDRVPGLLETRREWIQRTLAKFRGNPVQSMAESIGGPERLDLAAFGETWDILVGGTPSLSDDPVEASTKRRLVLGGSWQDAGTLENLRKWLVMRSRRGLGPWLERLSARHRLPYRRFAVRIQQTRWGSCSAKGTISLNAKLAFLPPSLVEYVLCHELCHTRHLDHSRCFWDLVESVLPGSLSLRKVLREAGARVPAWVQPQRKTERLTARDGLTFYLQ